MENQAVIYDFNTRTRWLVVMAILIGFVACLFLARLEPSDSINLLFVLSFMLFLIGLVTAVVENSIIAIAQLKAKRITKVRYGVIKLEK